MRQRVDLHRVTEFLSALAREADQPVRIYLTGGATALFYGWRASTIDVDLCIVPENDRMLRSIPALKEKMAINVELASPADFIPELPGWETRSVFIRQEGQAAMFHYDLYAQALSKY